MFGGRIAGEPEITMSDFLLPYLRGWHSNSPRLIRELMGTGLATQTDGPPT
jgi:hypothetical protein